MANEVKVNEVKVNEVKVNEIKDLVQQYIAQLSPSEKIVYVIAQKQLETSFCIEKSIGFLEYVKSQPIKNASNDKNP